MPVQYACDDFDVVRRRFHAIRGEQWGVCPKWADANFPSTDCWCHLGVPNGETLPCPPKPNTEVAV